MDSHEVVLTICAVMFGLLLGGFIQYSKDLSPKYECVNGVLHERMDQTKDVYVTLNTVCTKIK